MPLNSNFSSRAANFCRAYTWAWTGVFTSRCMLRPPSLFCGPHANLTKDQNIQFLSPARRPVVNHSRPQLVGVSLSQDLGACRHWREMWHPHCHYCPIGPTGPRDSFASLLDSSPPPPPMTPTNLSLTHQRPMRMSRLKSSSPLLFGYLFLFLQFFVSFHVHGTLASPILISPFCSVLVSSSRILAVDDSGKFTILTSLNTDCPTFVFLLPRLTREGALPISQHCICRIGRHLSHTPTLDSPRACQWIFSSSRSQ